MGYFRSVRPDATMNGLRICPVKSQEADMSAESTLSALSIISWEQSCSA